MIGAACLLAGCKHRMSSDAPRPLPVRPSPSEVAAACQHARPDCEIARQIPAYGGHFIDSARGTIVVYTTDPAQGPKLRALFMGKTYDGPGMQKKVATDVEIREGQFGYADLVHWRDVAISALMPKVAGVNSIGIDDTRNRISIGIDSVQSPGLRSRVLDVLRRTDVPENALIFTPQGPWRFQSGNGKAP